MMRWWNELKFILRKLNRRRADRELEEEIRTHLELVAQEKIESGYSQQDAHYAARRVFGNVLITKENSRAVWGFGLLESLWKDLRYSAKTLGKTPGFTTAAVLTLGLGIGVNTAIYSGINAIFFKPLAGAQNPEQLCRIKLLDRLGRYRVQVPYSDYLEINRANQTLGGLAAFRTVDHKVGLKGQPRQRMLGEQVSGNYFQVLGVRAALGRVLTPDDETDGSSNAIVLGHATWRNLFQADPEIIGKEILTGAYTSNERRFLIVGIAPPNFHGTQLPIDTGYWILIDRGVELKAEMERSRNNGGYSGFSLIGRMKRESDLRQVKAEMGLFFSNFTQLRPEVYLNRIADVEATRGQHEAGGGDVGAALIGSGAVVGVLLLITCANVAGLQLARAIGRRKEIAVRLALGASRWRIICLLLTESLLLALLGGTLAAALNFKTSALLGRAFDTILYPIPRTSRMGITLDFSPDWYVFIVTLLISILVGIVCGLVPALKISKADLTEVTKSEASLRTIRIGKLSWQNLLVVMQVAGSVLLLILAGLVLRIFLPIRHVDPGFETHNLFITEVNPFKRNSQIGPFVRDLQSRAATLPNVKSVVTGEGPPGGGGADVIILEDTKQKPFGDRHAYFFTVYSPKYFETLGIQLVAGRDFTEEDMSGVPSTVIIDERIARQAFPGQNPIGRRLRLDPNRNQNNITSVEIIGVVKNVNDQIWTKDRKGQTPRFYLPNNEYYSDMYLYVRTYHDPAATLPAIAKLIRSLDPETDFRLRTMEDTLYLKMLPSKIISAFSAFFGAMGLILQSVGLLGVMGYSVARRTKEIGIRMALGAARKKVLRMIIGEGLALTFTGIVIGVLAAAGLTRILGGVLRDLDLLSYGSAILVLLTAALLACYFPARKASKVDPMTALRHE